MNASTSVAPAAASGGTGRTLVSNPFSTRWVRPGAVPYCFATGVDAAGLVERLRACHWRGTIVGPHGSGKSTLLVALIPHIEQAGRQVRMIALHDGQRKLPPDFLRGAAGGAPSLVIVDGYEQLGWLARRRLHACCARNNLGLLTTVHHDRAARKLPVVYRTAADLATLHYLVQEILPPHGGLIRPDDIAVAFDVQRGNVRDVFFALYNLFEQRREQLR